MREDGGQPGGFYAEYREELAGNTETALTAQRMLHLTADEVVRMLDEYEDIQRLGGETKTSRRDYRQHFIYWALRRIGNMREKGGKGAPQRQTPPQSGVRLGYDEWMRPDGTRTYGTGTDTVPADAPPRPNSQCCWSSSHHSWIM